MGMFDDILDQPTGGVPTSSAKRGMFADILDPEPQEPDEPTPPEPTGAGFVAKETLKGIGRRLPDVAVAAAKGVVGVPQAAVGLANIPTLGYAGKGLEALGVDFKTTQAALDSMLSEEQKADQQAVQNAEGFLGKVVESVKRPSTIGLAAVESAPSMLGGAALARKAMSIAPKLPRLVAAALGEGAVGAGAMAEQVREGTETGTLTGKQAALSVGSGAATALLGAIGGKLAKRLGLGDVDTWFAAGTSEATKRGILSRIVGSALIEGAVEELPQSAQEMVARNMAEGRPWYEGVQDAAVQGMLTGAVMGAVGGAAGKGPSPAPTPTPTGARPTVETAQAPETAPTTAPEAQGAAIPAEATTIAPPTEQVVEQPVAGEPVAEVRSGGAVSGDVAATGTNADFVALQKKLKTDYAAGKITLEEFGRQLSTFRVIDKPTPAPIEKTQEYDTLQDVLSRYDDGDISAGDVLDAIDGLDIQNPEVSAATRKYRLAVEEDFKEYGMRGDVESYESEFINGLKSVAFPTKEASRAQGIRPDQGVNQAVPPGDVVEGSEGIRGEGVQRQAPVQPEPVAQRAEAAGQVKPAKPPELMTWPEVVANNPQDQQGWIVDGGLDRYGHPRQAYWWDKRPIGPAMSRFRKATYREYVAEQHRMLVWRAMQQQKPVSAVALRDVGLKAFEGYVRSGDRYVFKGEKEQAKPTAQPSEDVSDLAGIKGGVGAAAGTTVPRQPNRAFEFGLPPEQEVSSEKREERTFLTRTEEDDRTTKEALAELMKLPQEYVVQPTGEIKRRVQTWLDESEANVLEAERRFNDPAAPMDTRGAIGMALMEHYRAKGDTDSIVSIVSNLDVLGRGAGRLVQSLAEIDDGRVWRKLYKKYLSDRKLILPEAFIKEIDGDIDTAMGQKDVATRQSGVMRAFEKLLTKVPLRVGDWLDAYRYFNMLSNPQSHERNALGNLINATIVKPIVSLMHGDVKEVGKILRSTWWDNVLSMEPLRAAVRAYKKGDTEKIQDYLDNPSVSLFDSIKQGMGPQNAAARKAWRGLTSITRLMNAADHWAKAVIVASETTRLVRNGMSAEQAAKRANEVAEKLLYRNPMNVPTDKTLDWASRGLDTMGRELGKMRSKYRAISWTIPFLKTPLRIAQLNVAMSPIAYATRGMNVQSIAKQRHNKNYADLSTEQKQDVDQEYYQRVGLARMGMALTFAGFIAAFTGKTTWAPPEDEKARKLFYASGRVPYSILIDFPVLGPKWVSMAYLGPFMLAFAIPAAARDRAIDNPDAMDDNWAETVGYSMTAVIKMILDQTPVSQLGSLVDAASGDRDKSIWGEVAGVTNQLIPAGGFIRWVNKFIDPVYRKQREPFDKVLSGLPIASEQVKAITDPYGRPAKRELSEPVIPFRIGSREATFEQRYQQRMDKLRRNAAKRAKNEEK